MHTEHDNRTNGDRPDSLVPTPPTPPVHNFHKELLDRIDAIVNNTGYINETVSAIRQMAESGEIECEEVAATYVNGMCQIINAREITNQKAIELIRNMYECEMKTGKNVSGTSIADNAIALGLDISELISNLPPEQSIRFTRELLGMSN